MNHQHLPSNTASMATLVAQAPAPARRRALQLGLAFGTIGLSAALLSGCGGNESDPPAVSLAITPTNGKEGDMVSLTAEVRDGIRVASVSFYQITDSNETLLITLTASPYSTQIQLPSGSAGTSVRYIAKATDADGLTTSSAEATVSVTT